MSQHDFNIANQGFPATRSDINNALAALASTSSGASEPSTTYANQFWYDTTNNLLKFRNEADSAWITLAYLDQGTNEWEIRSAVIQAVDSAGISLKTDDGTARVVIEDDGDVAFDTDTLFVDAANDRVGIGTSSPSQDLHIKGTTNVGIRIEADSTSASIVNFADPSDTNVGQILYDHASNYMRFNTNDAEAMRIDSSGNLLVGKTSTANGLTTVGHSLEANGKATLTRDGGEALRVARKTSDGDMVTFHKDGSTVGSIGTSPVDGDFYIASAISGGCGLHFQTANILPATNTGVAIDNSKDWGGSSFRWDDIYATNGTIQTSDQNEKQQIASLTDAEITAAKAISKLFKTFKWNDSVAEKGDAARTHSGVIAQDVEQAMTDAGLNAGDYAFFISTTWWETQTEVPAVEADEENGVEAQEAYTRTDTYETAEEAPEGATERNRKGIRYPQLLSFIGAATEQRLASIESRLDALEA